MQRGVWRAGLLTFAFGALIVTTAWALEEFAAHQFSAHLRDRAAAALALAATGGTAYQWRFTEPDDLVAGYPFGTDDFSFSGGTLHWRDAGKPVDIGLPLSRAIDLRTYPRLRVEFETVAAGDFRAVTRETLTDEEHASAPVAFASGASSTILDLGKLAWWTAAGARTAPAPSRAEMLRLRFSPTGQEMRLHSAALLRPVDYKPLDIVAPVQIMEPSATRAPGHVAVFKLPFNPDAQKADIESIVQGLDASAATPPLILLPQRGRVEQQIALRNAVYSRLPAAILIPESDYAETFARAQTLVARNFKQARAPAQWAVVVGFGLLYLLMRLRPPANPRRRALAEVLLALIAPAWLVIGGYLDGAAQSWHYALIGLTIAYALSLSLRHRWKWNGSAGAWLWAGAVVIAALLIGWLLHSNDGHLVTAPGWRQVLRYLGWALLQQYLICAVSAERWRVVTDNSMIAVYLSALGFALMHTPNAALMLATFAGGLAWCAIYLRYRALLPLALSHTASALALAMLLPADILRSAEVSVRFFQ